MNKTNRKKMIALLLAFVLAASLLPSAFAASEEELEALRAERDAISAQRQERQAIVDELAEEQAGIVERKKALDQRNTLTLRQIDLNGRQIKLYQSMIDEEAAKVAEAQALEDEQLARYRARVREMEEAGGYNILTLILRARNLSELLTSIDDMREIMESDKKIEAEYVAAREHREEVKAKYEVVKAEFEGKQAELQEEQDRLEAELEEAARLIEEIQADIDSHAEEIAELEAAENEANALIDEMVAEIEAERRKNQAASVNSGWAGFLWPVDCYYITSCAGNRWHPITGGWKYHSGTDIGASYGMAVYAAAGGTVTLADWNGGYGNCVMIDHGNGYYTLYGHLSAINVYAGQWVGQGSVIGYVGSTGNSTGPHLHFEIRDGSGCLDPEGFFGGGFSYAPDAGN